MSFTPLEKSVEEVLGGKNRYQIPVFQRDFSWGKKNFYDFFYDLFQSSDITYDNPSVNKDKRYFFGMIFLLGDNNSPDEDKPYEVIDGQQRLTTITLFYAALRDIIGSIDPEYETDFGERLFMNKFEGGKSEQLQRLVNDSLNPFFPINILNMNNMLDDGATVKSDSSEQDWLDGAYNYIKNDLLSKDNIIKTINIISDCKTRDCSDGEYIKILDAFGNHLSISTLVCLYHKDSERRQAHLLFRNLNYRGKPLSQSDLIKNEIFALTEDAAKFASTKWKTIEKNVYAVGETMESFIYYYMRGRFKKVSMGNLFSRFTEEVHANKSEYIKYLTSLEDASNYYKIMLLPEDNATVFGEENFFIRDNNQSIKRNLLFYKKLSVFQFRNLLISLFECRDKGYITNKVFSNFISYIAYNQCIHVLARSSANKLTGIYDTATRDLLQLASIEDGSKRSKKVTQIVKGFKKAMLDKLPSIEQLYERDLRYTGKPHAKNKESEVKDHAMISFILGAIAEKEQSKSTNRGNDGLKFIHESTIEHIIDKENKCNNVYSIGNLLLLERDVHKDVKTEEEKKKMYSKSRITMSKNFYKKYPKFSETMIEKRKGDVFDSFYEIVKMKNS